MKKTALIYWPKKGNVEDAASKIVEKFKGHPIDLFTITQVDVETLPQYDLLIIGGSTVGADNWEDTHKTRWIEFFQKLGKIHLHGQKVAIYGLGDQVLYPDHFVDGIAAIREEFARHHVDFIGYWPVKGYDFTGSRSAEGDHFLGLALDNDQQPELTDERIHSWVKQIQKEAGF